MDLKTIANYLTSTQVSKKGEKRGTNMKGGGKNHERRGPARLRRSRPVKVGEKGEGGKGREGGKRGERYTAEPRTNRPFAEPQRTDITGKG